MLFELYFSNNHIILQKIKKQLYLYYLLFRYHLMNTLQDQCHLSLHHTKPHQQSEAIAQTLQEIELPFQTITIRND